MRKKLHVFSALVLIMTVALSGMAFAATSPQGLTVSSTSAQVLVNGKSTSFEAYTIEGYTYFNLRDIALAVNGTEKQFAVTYDSEKNAINLLSKTPYTSNGTEFAAGDGQAKPATPNTAKIYQDGSLINLTAYTIGGYNFFKLRDLAQAFNIGVTWDAATSTIGIDTTQSYVAPAAAPAPVAAKTPVTAPTKVAGTWYTPNYQDEFSYIVEQYAEKEGVFLGYRYKDFEDPNNYVTIYSSDMQIIAETKYPGFNNYFSEGLCGVVDAVSWNRDEPTPTGHYGYIDTAGNEVIPCIYDYAGAFKFGLAFVRKTEGGTQKTLIINKKNETVLSFKESELPKYASGATISPTVRPNYILLKGIYYDHQGKEISVEARKNTSDAYGYWDENGDRMDTDYDGHYHDNWGYEYAVYNKSEVDAFIKSYQKTYSDIKDVGNGFFIVTSKGKKGVVNKNNNIIVPIQYRMIDACYTETDTYFVTNYDYDDGKAIYSSTGKQLLDGTKFNRYYYAGHNAIYYYKWLNAGWGIISLSGEDIVPNSKKYHKFFYGWNGLLGFYYDSSSEPNPHLLSFYTTTNMQVKADTTSLKATIAKCNKFLADKKAAGIVVPWAENLSALIAKATKVANSKNPIWIDVNTMEALLMSDFHNAALMSKSTEDKVKDAKEFVELQKERIEKLKQKLEEKYGK